MSYTNTHRPTLTSTLTRARRRRLLMNFLIFSNELAVHDTLHARQQERIMRHSASTMRDADSAKPLTPRGCTHARSRPHLKLSVYVLFARSLVVTPCLSLFGSHG